MIHFNFSKQEPGGVFCVSQLQKIRCTVFLFKASTVLSLGLEGTIPHDDVVVEAHSLPTAPREGLNTGK